jgi:hypothetical protein
MSGTEDGGPAGTDSGVPVGEPRAASAPPRVVGLRFAEPAAAVDLSGFLRRLLRYDRAAVVRLVATGSVVAAYGYPPFDVYAVRTAKLAPLGAEPAGDGDVAGVDVAGVDVTVSAGQLLDAIRDDGTCPLPPAVAGPGWAGLLPPRAGWTPAGTLPAALLTEVVARGVAEFRERAGAFDPAVAATRAALDALAGEIWGRPLDAARFADLPLRAAHALHGLGCLGPADGPPVAVARHARWLRLDAPYGTVALRLGAPMRSALLVGG